MLALLTNNTIKAKCLVCYVNTKCFRVKRVYTEVFDEF